MTCLQVGVSLSRVVIWLPDIVNFTLFVAGCFRIPLNILKVYSRRHFSSLGIVWTFFKKLLKYSWFAMLYQFLLYSKVTQSYICVFCICVYIIYKMDIDIHSFSHIIFHHVLSQEIRYSSLCCSVRPHCLSILNGIVCITNLLRLPLKLVSLALFCPTTEAVPFIIFSPMVSPFYSSQWGTFCPQPLWCLWIRPLVLFRGSFLSLE